ncbi:MAG: hypothetical protein B6D63_03360 [Candidatus Latescibacteria bacterium 4484_7]|nr:MAG: hypothetical protein B6D63_03360 [Candidatus Latescibacteria bacterium 4484_7]
MISGDYAVSVERLTKRFGRFTAVDNVSFDIVRGEIFGLLGANGAGKTTTIRMLAGLLKPSSGRGTVAGFDINRDYEKIKRRIGYMSQKFSLYEDLTVYENIRFFGGVYGLTGKQIRERFEEIASHIGLSGLMERRTDGLPPGIRQRLALANAILHRPLVLFLDEPTSGVDPIMRRQFWDIINSIAADGMAVLVTTHYMDEAEYCNNLMVMRDGKKVATGSPGELKKQFHVSSIEEVFVSTEMGKR